jgi:hypothetical protein
MELELNETQIDYVRCLLSEDLDRNRGHIEWLQRAPARLTRKTKTCSTRNAERAVEQALALLAVLDGGSR